MAVRFSDDQVQLATGASARRAGARASYTAVCTDSRRVSPDGLFVALRGERYDGHDFLEAAVEAGAAGVLVERGRGERLSAPHVAVFEVDDTLAALGALARFHRLRFGVPVGAVTGSNGKTTTKELVGAILAVRGPTLKTEGNLNNEIGVPLTLFNFEPSHTSAIVELGMNHPGEIARLTDVVRPDAGLITVVQPAHLEGLGSIDGVARAKAELFRGLGAAGTAVVNADDARVVREAEGLPVRIVTFGRRSGVDVQLAEVTRMGFEGLALGIDYRGARSEVSLRLVGEHNAMNATGAFALALALGCTPQQCVAGLSAAGAAHGRLELRPTRGGAWLIDDAYNANPASMAAALETLAALAPEGRATAILGDMLELGAEELTAHQALGEAAAARAAQVAFFGPRSAAAYERARPRLGAATAHFLEPGALVAWLAPRLRAGDVVLAKASRGMRLERVVEALLSDAPGGAH